MTQVAKVKGADLVRLLPVLVIAPSVLGFWGFYCLLMSTDLPSSLLFVVDPFRLTVIGAHVLVQSIIIHSLVAIVSGALAWMDPFSPLHLWMLRGRHDFPRVLRRKGLFEVSYAFVVLVPALALLWATNILTGLTVSLMLFAIAFGLAVRATSRMWKHERMNSRGEARAAGMIKLRKASQIQYFRVATLAMFCNTLLLATAGATAGMAYARFVIEHGDIVVTSTVLQIAQTSDTFYFLDPCSRQVTAVSSDRVREVVYPAGAVIRCTRSGKSVLFRNSE